MDAIAADASHNSRKRQLALLGAVFVSAIVLSAFLLFSIQPMFAKMALPLLGGAPNVWNTAMVFFQAALLLGYVYAHLVSRFLPFKAQLAAHVLVLALGAIALPIAIAPDAAPTENAPALWLIALFAVSVGAPFFALSANAPLLQRWFSYTGHPDAHDPYFLYAASNVGSLVALLSYPVAIEPLLGLSGQSMGWTALYALLSVGIISAGLAAIGDSGGQARIDRAQTQAAEAPPPSWGRRAAWAGVAAVPSGLMLAVTSHITANVAAAPLLWVAPLALYLMTFIIAFSRNPAIRSVFIAGLFPFVVIAAIVFSAIGISPYVLLVAANLLFFFVIAQFCHNRLASLRPNVRHLTEFYLFMSLGGVIGGAFTALLAPVLFNDIHEYPILLVASAFVAITAAPRRRDGAALGRTVAIALFGSLALWALSISLSGVELPAAFILFFGVLPFAVLVYRYRRRPAHFASSLICFAVGVHLCIAVSSRDEGSAVVFQDRSFFGVMRVERLANNIGVVHKFIHGDTLHNVQVRNDALRRVPLLYYRREGPFGEAVEAARAIHDRPLRVAVVGLGAGATACLSNDDETWMFFEIDPLVVRMATDSDHFTYLSDCQPDARIVIGDARLMLDREIDNSFDLILVDAFSSDSIPAHLITMEALALYRQKLNEKGMVFFHTSNRVLDISSVAESLAIESGLAARRRAYVPDDGPLASVSAPVSGVLVGPEDVLRAGLRGREQWLAAAPHPFVRAWTDDYSNIISAIAARGARKDEPKN